MASRHDTSESQTFTVELASIGVDAPPHAVAEVIAEKHSEGVTVTVRRREEEWTFERDPKGRVNAQDAPDWVRRAIRNAGVARVAR